MLKRTMAFVQFIIDIQLPIMSPIVNSPNVCDKVELALLDWVSIINNLVWEGGSYYKQSGLGRSERPLGRYRISIDAKCKLVVCFTHLISSLL